MRALCLDSAGMTLRRDYPVPTPAPGESLVRVSLAGICGTDLELARGYMNYTGVPGHEFVGVVVQSAAPEQQGQRVVGEINASCDTCDLCRAGLGRHCPNRTVLGILGRDGAFADFLVLPERNLIPLPATEAAVFVEPLAAAYEIFAQVRLERDDRILILGDGRLGALVALACQAEGYRPLLAGHHQAKLEFLAAQNLEVALEYDLKRGFDTVVDCTGRASGLTRAFELVRPRGRIILKTTAAAGAPLVINEVTLLGSRCGRFAPALAAIAAGRVDPRPLISGIFSCDAAIAAFDAASSSDNFKCLLQFT